MRVPPVPALERAFEVTATLGPLQDLGPTRAGHRRIVPVVGGSVTGTLQGRILPGGADWQVVRVDGSIDVDARYTAELDDGALLFISARGVRSGDPAILDALLRGEDVDPSAYYFRAAVSLECAARPELERSVYIASYVRGADEIRYDAYRVT